MNVIDVWLEYQCITGTVENQADLYTYLDGEMIDNTNNKFIMRSA